MEYGRCLVGEGNWIHEVGIDILFFHLFPI